MFSLSSFKEPSDFPLKVQKNKKNKKTNPFHFTWAIPLLLSNAVRCTRPCNFGPALFSILLTDGFQRLTQKVRAG